MKIIAEELKVKFSLLDKYQLFTTKLLLPQIWIKLDKNRAMDIKNNTFIVKFMSEEVVNKISIKKIIYD